MQWHWNWGLWALAAVLVFWSIGAYNRVMLLRNEIARAFAQLDDALTRRFARTPDAARLARSAARRSFWRATNRASSASITSSSGSGGAPSCCDDVAFLSRATMQASGQTV